MSTLKNVAFQDVALTLSGNSVVCTIKGTATYEMDFASGAPEIDEVFVLTQDNALVEVDHHEPMWLPIKRAVSKYIRNLPTPKTRETSIDNEAV